MIARRTLLMLIAASAAGLAACAEIPTKPSDDPPRFRALIQPVELRLTVPQAGLRTDYSPSWKVRTLQLGTCAITVAATGFCLALSPTNLDAPEVKAAALRLAPLNDATVDVHFDHLSVESLKSALQREGIAVAGSTLLKHSDDAADEAAFFASSAGSLMYLDVAYRLTDDFSRFEVRAQAEVFARAMTARRMIRTAESEHTDRVKGAFFSRSNAIYWLDFAYQATLPVAGTDADQNAAQWAAGGGRLIREALLDGIAQLGRVAAHDFGTRLWADEVKLPPTRAADGTRARLVEEIADRGRLLRLPDGQLLFEATLRTSVAEVAP